MCQTSCARSPGNTRAATAKSVACALSAPPLAFGERQKSGRRASPRAQANELGPIPHARISNDPKATTPDHPRPPLGAEFWRRWLEVTMEVFRSWGGLVSTRQTAPFDRQDNGLSGVSSLCAAPPGRCRRHPTADSHFCLPCLRHLACATLALPLLCGRSGRRFGPKSEPYQYLNTRIAGPDKAPRNAPAILPQD